MRVKVRFNAEAGQPPMVVDMRFLPRIGEQIHLGFRKVIEVLEVRRVENDNRYGGIVRAKFVHIERRVAPPAAPPMPMPPIPVRSISTPPPPPAPPTPPPAPAPASTPMFGDLSFEELLAQTQPPSANPAI